MTKIGLTLCHSLTTYKGGVAQWVARLTRNVRVSSKAPVVSLSTKLYPYCLVLVGHRNGFEPIFTIELK